MQTNTNCRYPGLWSWSLTKQTVIYHFFKWELWIKLKDVYTSTQVINLLINTWWNEQHDVLKIDNQWSFIVAGNPGFMNKQPTFHIRTISLVAEATRLWQVLFTVKNDTIVMLCCSLWTTKYQVRTQEVLCVWMNFWKVTADNIWFKATTEDFHLCLTVHQLSGYSVISFYTQIYLQADTFKCI